MQQQTANFREISLKYKMIYKLKWKNQAELTFEFDQLTTFAEIPSVIDPKTLQSLMFFCEKKGDKQVFFS